MIRSKSPLLGSLAIQAADLIPFFVDFSKKVRPEFDALGDVWSLDAKTIGKVRDFKRRVISKMKTPPKYDLQTYFGLMLEEGACLETICSIDCFHR